MNSNIGEKMEELQNVEHNLQHMLSQRQTLELEINEIKNALSELESAKDECYKIVGNIMVKSAPESLKSELHEKSKIASLKLSSIEKQQSLLEKKSSELRGQINSSSSADNSKKK